MTKFFFKFKKNFLPIPSILGAKKFFQKIWLCHAQLDMGFYLAPRQIQRNLVIQSQEKNQANGRTERWTHHIH